MSRLAANLSTQVRAIAEVSTAVTKGDLTRWPCSMRVNLARWVLSQSCSVFFCVVSRRLRIISLTMSFRAAYASFRKHGEDMHEVPVEPKLNILVVDDNEAALFAIQQTLGGLEQNLVLARSGKEAFRALLKQDFDVILLDVRMPDRDGFETATLIRRREKTAHTPIIFIFITAFARDETEVAQGYSLGAVDYIFAPIVPAILRAKVSAYVEMKRQADRILQLELQEHQRRLAVARENLDEQIKRNLFFMLSLDLLCIMGFDGWFLQLNPAWERELGFDQEELLARPLLDIVDAADREKIANAME